MTCEQEKKMRSSSRRRRWLTLTWLTPASVIGVDVVQPRRRRRLLQVVLLELRSWNTGSDVTPCAEAKNCYISMLCVCVWDSHWQKLSPRTCLAWKRSVNQSDVWAKTNPHINQVDLNEQVRGAVQLEPVRTFSRLFISHFDSFTHIYTDK